MKNAYISNSLHDKLFSWIFTCLRKADKNKDDKLSQSEVKNFLRLINIDVDDDYADMIFQVRPAELEMTPGRAHCCRLMFIQRKPLNAEIVEKNIGRGTVLS